MQKYSVSSEFNLFLPHRNSNLKADLKNIIINKIGSKKNFNSANKIMDTSILFFLAVKVYLSRSFPFPYLIKLLTCQLFSIENFHES